MLERLFAWATICLEEQYIIAFEFAKNYNPNEDKDFFSLMALFCKLSYELENGSYVVNIKAYNSSYKDKL